MLQPQRPVRMDSGRFEDLPRIARRFLAYAEMDTASDPSSGASPSTRRQLAFAQILAIELREAGAEDVRVSNAGVVTATTFFAMVPRILKKREAALAEEHNSV